MTLVLDSSVALAWHFEDEQTEAGRAALFEVAEADAVVPGLWRYEIANGLQMAVRRGRIDAALRDRAWAI
jgi:predicted nucleic acid-binding protein